jgi:hypothetical protein
MTRIELQQELDKLGIGPANYSLDGELKPDAIVVYPNYGHLEVFYIDERGGRNDEKSFGTAEEACDYILKLFIDAKNVEKRFGIKTLK